MINFFPVFKKIIQFHRIYIFDFLINKILNNACACSYLKTYILLSLRLPSGRGFASHAEDRDLIPGWEILKVLNIDIQKRVRLFDIYFVKHYLWTIFSIILRKRVGSFKRNTKESKLFK